MVLYTAVVHEFLDHITFQCVQIPIYVPILLSGYLDSFQCGALLYRQIRKFSYICQYTYAYVMLSIYIKLPDLKVRAHFALVNDAFQSMCTN